MKAEKNTLLPCLIATVFMAIFILSCSEKSSDSGVDNIPPADIIDLSVRTGGGIVELSWSAPGDDGYHGMVNKYDIRYSGNRDILTTWDFASRYADLVTPVSAQWTQRVYIGALCPDSFYYFAVKSSDEAGNTSNISNIAVSLFMTDFIVKFADPKLDNYIHELLGIPGDIYYSQLMPVKAIQILNAGCSSLLGVEYMGNLESIQIVNGSIDLLGPLWALTKLRELSFYNNKLIYMTHLDQPHKLVSLDLGHNQISDPRYIQELTNLQSLNLSGNRIENISVLADMNSLESLNLDTNLIADITPLAGLESLTTLRLSGNDISDIDALNSLPNLESLHLENNEIEDISPLAGNSGLGEGDTVYLNNNPLSSQSLNEYIPALEARGVIVIY